MTLRRWHKQLPNNLRVFSPCAFAKIVSARVRSKVLLSPGSLRAFSNGLPSSFARWRGRLYEREGANLPITD